MIKYCLKKWDENKDYLRQTLSIIRHLHEYEYEDIVRLVVTFVFNTDQNGSTSKWDADRITMIDNGDYQGTLLFLIPQKTYQPSEYEYLMTFVSYGSCSGCDTLQLIQSSIEPDQVPSEKTVDELMMLCKDIVCNTIKPYNSGWRGDSMFNEVVKGGDTT